MDTPPASPADLADARPPASPPRPPASPPADPAVLVGPLLLASPPRPPASPPAYPAVLVGPLPFASPPLLFEVEDVIREILLRIRPEHSALLFRFACASRSWRSILTEPQFAVSYRAFHRIAPLIGFLINLREDFADLARFLPTTHFAPPTRDHFDLDALDARHGRVLMHSFFSDKCQDRFTVWEPMSDYYSHVLPPSDAEYSNWAATVLCREGDDGCIHLKCREQQFALVFLCGNRAAGTLSAWVYTDDAGWSDATTVESTVLLSPTPATLVGASLYFRTRQSSGRIVRYDGSHSRLSVIDPPRDGGRPLLDFVMLPASGGGETLRLASIQRSSVQMWEETGVGNSHWMALTRIDLWTSLQRILPRSPGTSIIGVSETRSLIFFDIGGDSDCFYVVDVESGDVQKSLGKGNFMSVIPSPASVYPI